MRSGDRLCMEGGNDARKLLQILDFGRGYIKW